MPHNVQCSPATDSWFKIRNKTIIESNGINSECEIRFDENANDARTWTTLKYTICMQNNTITIIDNTEWSESLEQNYYHVYANQMQSNTCITSSPNEHKDDHKIDEQRETMCHWKIACLLNDGTQSLCLWLVRRVYCSTENGTYSDFMCSTMRSLVRHTQLCLRTNLQWFYSANLEFPSQCEYNRIHCCRHRLRKWVSGAAVCCTCVQIFVRRHETIEPHRFVETITFNLFFRWYDLLFCELIPPAAHATFGPEKNVVWMKFLTTRCKCTNRASCALFSSDSSHSPKVICHFAYIYCRSVTASGHSSEVVESDFIAHSHCDSVNLAQNICLHRFVSLKSSELFVL